MERILNIKVKRSEKSNKVKHFLKYIQLLYCDIKMLKLSGTVVNHLPQHFLLLALSFLNRHCLGPAKSPLLSCTHIADGSCGGGDPRRPCWSHVILSPATSLGPEKDWVHLEVKLS